MSEFGTQGRRGARSTGPALRDMIVLILILTLAGAPSFLQAAAPRGAEIRVALISPGTVSGELIGISSEKLVLQVGERERTVAIGEIDSVHVFRESLKPLGIIVGAVAGGLIGYAIGKKGMSDAETSGSSPQWLGAGAGALLGGAAGWGVGTLLSKDKVYEFRGAPPEKIAQAIEDLRKMARVPDFK